MHDAKGPDGFRALSMLPDLLRTAVPVGTETDNSNRRNVTEVRRYVAAVNDGEEIRPVRITAWRVNNGPEQLRSVNLLPKTTRPPGNMVRRLENQSPNTLKAGEQLTVRQLLPGVKEEGTGRYSAQFATGRMAERNQLSDAEVDSRWASMRSAFPEIDREWSFVRGEVQDVLQKAGYTGDGVPVAMVALPEFEQRVERCAKHLGWDSAQITDLICKKTVLPDRLSATDFEMLVARLAVDVSAASKRRIAAAANAQHGAQYVVNVLEVARHSATKAGRPKPSDQDVLDAIGDRPTFPAVVTKTPRKWPARIASDDTFSPSSPVSAPSVHRPRREIAPAMHEADSD